VLGYTDTTSGSALNKYASPEDENSTPFKETSKATHPAVCAGDEHLVYNGESTEKSEAVSIFLDHRQVTSDPVNEPV
jgi:hypothetical protein